MVTIPHNPPHAHSLRGSRVRLLVNTLLFLFLEFKKEGFPQRLPPPDIPWKLCKKLRLAGRLVSVRGLPAFFGYCFFYPSKGVGVFEGRLRWRCVGEAGYSDPNIYAFTRKFVGYLIAETSREIGFRTSKKGLEGKIWLYFKEEPNVLLEKNCLVTKRVLGVRAEGFEGLEAVTPWLSGGFFYHIYLTNLGVVHEALKNLRCGFLRKKHKPLLRVQEPQTP